MAAPRQNGLEHAFKMNGNGSQNHPPGEEDGAQEGLILIDMNCKPIALDSKAAAMFNEVDPNGQNGTVPRLPAQIAELIAAIFKTDTPSGAVRISVNSHGYVCRAFSMRPLAGDPMVALHIRREMSINEIVRRVATEYRLTDREQEVLVGVAQGLTSKELAGRMHISPNTIKAFLRLIMIKLGVPTRAGLVGKLIEGNWHINSTQPCGMWRI